MSLLNLGLRMPNKMGGAEKGMQLSKVILFVFLFVLFAMKASAGELSLNLIAINPSEQDSKEIDVKYFLPKELQPSDVLDSGELKVGYDVEKGSYFVSGKVTFQPKESRTFKIKVNDVWVITPEEINVLKQNLEGNLSLLESNKEQYANAKREKEKIVEQLDLILTQQQNYSENIERRIEQYRAYAASVEKIRQKIYDPNYLSKEAQVSEDEDVLKTVKFVLQVKNPSDAEAKKIKHKHYLPSEIHEEDVLDKQGYDVRFDEAKNKSYLLKEEDFGPGEEKKSEIILKDIWRFPVNKLNPMEKRAEIAIKEIKGSAYETSGQYLFDDVAKTIELIRATQDQELGPDQHIGIFRTNEKRYDQVKQNVERLEQMLAIVRAKKLEELEGSKVKNILKKLQALRGLRALSEAIFKKGISVTTTWRIIFGSIIFISLFTTYHFIVWSKRSGKMGEELGLNPGEQIKVVPKPGAQQKAEE